MSRVVLALLPGAVLAVAAAINMVWVIPSGAVRLAPSGWAGIRQDNAGGVAFATVIVLVALAAAAVATGRIDRRKPLVGRRMLVALFLFLGLAGVGCTIVWVPIGAALTHLSPASASGNWAVLSVFGVGLVSGLAGVCLLLIEVLAHQPAADTA